MKDGRLRLRWASIEDVEAQLNDLDLLEAMEIQSITVRLTAAGYPKVLIEVVPSELEIELEEVDLVYRGTLEEEPLEWVAPPSGRQEWESWPSQTRAMEEEE